MFIATSLSYYKQERVRQALVDEAQDKEISVMYVGGKFGKRPDILTYENDVLELAKKKASSFHCSEELWHNPLNITTGMKRHELDELRLGWDLILDVDCPNWEFSKLITHLFVKALQDHGISSIGVKFSGNKGFHVAVPFEAFPESIESGDGPVLVKNLFPEGPRKIAAYLLNYITEKYTSVKNNTVTFKDAKPFSLDELNSIANESKQSLFHFRCVHCKSTFAENPLRERKYYPCSTCGHITQYKGQQEELITCAKCTKLVKLVIESGGCPSCKQKAGMEQFVNLLSVVEVDTVLIASRHLYRMPYSLHEKSGLLSLPIRIDEILSFDKERAKPEHVSFDTLFIDRSKCDSQEGKELLLESFSQELQQLSHIHADVDKKQVLQKKIELPTDAIPEEFFPPCIQNISKGLEDGKKRAMFVLINFLRVSGWAKDDIEKYMYEWNERNPEPLKEQYLKGQLSQLKKDKAPLPPPNCNNRDYYKSLLVCTPDEFCPKIRNPAMYAKRKAELASKRVKKSPKKSAKKASKVQKKKESPSNEEKKSK